MPTCTLLGLVFHFTIAEFSELLRQQSDAWRTSQDDQLSARERVVLCAVSSGLTSARLVYEAYPTDLASISTTQRVLRKLRRKGYLSS